MTQFPFETETTPYAYVSADTSSYSERFGHLRLNLRLPALARAYQRDMITLTITSQCSPPTGYTPEPEPFYALRMVASSHSDGMSVEECQAAAKVMAKLQKAIERLDEAAGAPAVLLPDYFMRVLKAAKVEHVYAPDRINGSNCHIADQPHFTPATFDQLRYRLQILKRDVLTFCGHFEKAAA